MMQRASRDVWKQRVAEWKRSGVSRGAFCAKHAINPNTLTYWGTRLRREEAAAAGEPTKAGKASGRKRRRAARAKAPEPAFVEVQLPRQPSGLGRFELELGAGRVLRIPDDFNPAGLRNLLTVLEEAR